MTSIPTLSDSEIEARVGSASFGRGLQYARRGAIFDGRRQETTLKARSDGSGPEAYRLWVTFDGGRISAADCSCPVGAGGHCKHTAALLLTWRDKPEQFVEVEAVDAALERRTKPQLIALIKQMLLQEPELEALLETPLPADGGPASADPAVFRKRAAAVFRRAGHEWGVEVELASELLTIKALGDGFRTQGDLASAVAVYDAVSEVVIERLEEYEDQEGELGAVITACAEGLGECLAAGPTDPATRERILEALFAAYRCDLDQGGRDIGAGAADFIVDHATAEEKRLVAEWVREAMAETSGTGDSYGRAWTREAYGALLLDLELETLDDESFLQICRETGRIGDLVERLLALGRIDEATEVAERVDDYRLLGLADLFVTHDQAEVAERLVGERSGTSQDTRFGEWLEKHYLARGEREAALEIGENIFRARPSLERYRTLRRIATELGRWETKRPELLETVRTSQYWSHLLVEIYLEEGEIDQALRSVRSHPVATSAYGFGYGEPLTRKVARAAEAQRPREAIELYQQEVEQLIKRQGRDNYREASRLLQSVRALYERLNEREAWARYVEDLRERYRRLPALKQELVAAGL